MMKQTIFARTRFGLRLMLCLLSLSLMLPFMAKASYQEDLARSNLTEVYGYSTKDAEQFEFLDDGKGKLTYWPKDKPEWVYTILYEPGQNAWLEMTTPFFRGEVFSSYPGESAVREFFYKAREEKWFLAWNQDSQKAMYDFLEEGGYIKMSRRLRNGLTQGDITAAQAIDAFFASTHGEPYQWTKATMEWRDEILKENGLTKEPIYSLREGQLTHIEGGITDPADIIEFGDSLPQKLQKAAEHPKLAGYTLLSGALVEMTNMKGETRGGALAAFEKEDKRLLMMFFLDDETKEYVAVPISEHALFLDRGLKISNNFGDMRMRLTYEPKDNQVIMLDVIPQRLSEGETNCAIDNYVVYHTDKAGYFRAFPGPRGWRATPEGELMIDLMEAPVIGYMEGINSPDDLPLSIEGFQKLNTSLIPSGYAAIGGVNLRQKTSSRSHSLGIMKAGTLGQILGTEPGDPHTWLHVKIGSKEGYVSTVYVSPPASQMGTSVVYLNSLQVAKTKKALDLKMGTGFLDGKVMELTEGQKMHIISEENGWLYVVVPQGEPGWFMDVEGTFGYVWKGDVVIASSSLKLDWME